MRLLSFQVRGYKNLQIPLRIEGLGPLNILGGPNNVGKSNLIEAMGLLLLVLRRIFHRRRVRRWLGPPNAQGGVKAAPGEDIDDPDDPRLALVEALSPRLLQQRSYSAEEIFNRMLGEPIELTARFALTAEEWSGAGLRAPTQGTSIDIDVRLKRRDEIVEARVTRCRFADGTELGADAEPKELRDRVLRLCGHVFRGRLRSGEPAPPFALIRTDRVVYAEPPLIATDVVEAWVRQGRELVSHDLCLALYDARESFEARQLERWQRFVHQMARFRSMLGDGQLVVTYDRRNERATLALQQGATRIPMNLQGVGMQQAINLIGRMLFCGATVLAIEEPEMNLMPEAQQALWEAFTELVGSSSGPQQLLLTSHSSIFTSQASCMFLHDTPDGPQIRPR